MKSVAQYIADGAPAPIEKWGWKNKALPGIHMPYSVCRLWLDVTAVRIERLQSISEADARAEGISEVPFYPDDGFPLSLGYMPGPDDKKALLSTRPTEAYRALWESIHGPESWEQDPWVFVLSFTVLSTHAATSAKAKPILFSAPMIRALLARKKTQTRRGLDTGTVAPVEEPWVFDQGHFFSCATDGTAAIVKPRWAVGDRLWVREGVRRNP